MADTLWNDIVYTDVLQSDGFVIDYAVCTTYSLDMPSLLSVPFMLGTMTDLTETAMRSPHLILETINQSAGKFAVFCNAGCIAVPQANSKVYSLLEQSVVQVALQAKGGGFVNFHPKVWIIKETNPDTGTQQIKLIVLSRNLTGSNDLDVVCELVGKIGSKPATRKAQIQHAPLVDFLTWLIAKADNRTIRKNMRLLCNDINYIERFDLTESPFEDYEFFPMGIPEYDGYAECFEQSMLNHVAEMLVISPFVDKNILNQMVDCSPGAKKTLITRHASVTQDIIRLFKNEVYVPKEVLTDKVEKDVAVDLHEKVYFVRRYEGNLSYNHLYLGSTNATMNGFGRNVEFLLHLKFAPYKSSYEKFRNELINDSKECMFEQVISVLEEGGGKEDVSNELMLRRAIAAIQKAQVTSNDSSYTVTIQYLPNKMPSEPVFLYPLGCDRKEQELTDDLTFKDMPLDSLTEFYTIRIGDLRRLIKIQTEGMPTDERDKAIFRSFINTKGKFINYLAFMLTDDVEQYILESQQLEKELAYEKTSALEQQISTSLYEDMVKMAYKYPERIASIRQIVEKADETVIPDHFMEMYNTFENVIKRIKRL
ncbi:hypothetical protein DW083_00945 [Parabacteroides sp. AF48-14]|uniref:phospholipase D family protein n=1 Tax=Parabacteroides sp. AF48-14 TaxID=2292052 RepID=UPI000F002D43|nr:phospholipase D family protein [Parabacteroides sp. AF48-14]RHO75350.1 hypothetical protein DW083_00945 [Parabacteroides sp. AF48-14]